MNRGTLFRPLVGVAALAAGVGFSATPASARTCTVTAIVQGGRQVTVTVDIPPGTPVEEVELPGVHVPVVSIVSTTCALKTPTPSPTPKPKRTPTPEPAETPAADPKGSERQQGSSRGQEEERPSKKADEKTEKKSEPNRSDRAGKAKPPKPEKDESSQPPPTKSGNRAPTPDDPGYTLADPSPARIGVPNFVIEKFRIPPFLLPVYQAAGIQYGVRWEVLAAINEIETDYGRNLNVSSAGAMGWMQFIRSSWKSYGVDGNEDGLEDPYNPVDAIFAAARYLRAAGADKDLRRAIFAYNHADWYVDSVLMRANVIGGLPSNLVGSLTGLTQGRFPVYAKASYANALTAREARKRKRGNPARVIEGRRNKRGIEIFARRGAPVVAVNDGRVTAMGQNDRLGRYIKLEDVYGNTFTYARLGKAAEAYPKPKTRTVTPEQVAREMKLPPPDPKPSVPASQTTKGGRSSKSAPGAAASAVGLPARPKRSLKQRLFANPERPRARAAGGAEQLLERDTSAFASYYTPVLGLEPADVNMRRLRPGVRVAAGTILGRIGRPAGRLAPHVLFEIRPAGRGAPRIDPKPILDGWQLLETTEVYRAANRNPFFGKGAEAPTLGQVLLMSKEQLAQRVLADPRVDIYGCGRQDVRTGQVDRRVLATLEFLVASGFKPTVTSLKCGHSYLTASGNVSNHSSGNAVDIAAINGIPILGHQGKGSITEIVVQRLLTLQGTMRPDEIITLMEFEGATNTLALGDHADHIHVGWRPVNGLPLLRRGRKRDDSVMKPGQWTRLIDRLGSIPNPMVAPTPSKYAVKVKRASRAHRGD